MEKKIVCIECPASCSMNVRCEGAVFIEAQGNKCPKGLTYAKSEIENPTRIVTSTVTIENAKLRMLPVRTDLPIPKSKIAQAMSQIRKMRLKGKIEAGQVLDDNFMGLGVKLISCRPAP